MARLNMKKLASNSFTRGIGAASGGAANPMLDKIFPATMDGKIKALVKVAVGAVAPEFVPKLKIADPIGAGLVGAATSDFLRENVSAFASTSGIGKDDLELDSGYVIDEDLAGIGVDEDIISAAMDDEGGEIVIEGDENTLS